MRYALLSVFDKTGIVALAQALHHCGFTIISTGGTYHAIEQADIPVTQVEDITSFPEILDGRVKTLHPKILGGILSKRDKISHMNVCQKHAIPRIDCVVVNLYPFEDMLLKNAAHGKTLEMIDIGGSSLIRAAAKNYTSVIVMTSPDQYEEVTTILQKSDDVPMHYRKQLAYEGFNYTAVYDSMIAHYFASETRINTLDRKRFTRVFTKKETLRYGENPHQPAALYQVNLEQGLHDITQIQGKKLSYNNLMDAYFAWETVKRFEEPTVAVIKHANPCGVASHNDIVTAYKLAVLSDAVSSFGSIIASNRKIDKQLAEEMATLFIEVIIAPSFSEEAKHVFRKKENLRLIPIPETWKMHPYRYRDLGGSSLIQHADALLSFSKSEVVTETKPDKELFKDLIFAMKVVSHVKSNAIVIAKSCQTIGIGAGQMSRIDAVDIALKKSQGKATNAVLASDAFFPFDDSVTKAASHGIKGIIQPGGSKRDNDSIKVCNEHGIAMIFTHHRHFLH